MNAILFFVKSGKVTDLHRTAAKAISQATDKKVVFRNSSAAEQTGEKAEPNEGVAGRVPATYSHCPRYDDAGQLTNPGVPAEVQTELPLNALGLPMGAPDNVQALREALTGAGVEFHPRNKAEKLVDLYREAFLSE